MASINAVISSNSNMKCSLFLFLVVVLSINSSSGFIVGSWTQIAVKFKNTRFHDIQAQSVLCQLQFDLLTQAHGLQAEPPVLFSACASRDWLGALKMNAANAQLAIAQFMKQIQDPDLNVDTQHDAVFHFDNDQIEPTNERLIQETADLLAAVQTSAMRADELAGFRASLARILHTIQDFYSHSNWVEAGFPGIAENLGFSEEFKQPLNRGQNPSCTKCVNPVLTPAEQADLDAGNNAVMSIVATLGYFQMDDVFVCRDNVLEKQAMFTAYCRVKQAGACSHGGGMDDTSRLEPTGGINKDGEQLLFSPHYYLHQDAAAKAVEASLFYMNALKDRINDTVKWARILGIHEDDEARAVFKTSDGPGFELAILDEKTGQEILAEDVEEDVDGYTILLRSTAFKEMEFDLVWARVGGQIVIKAVAGSGKTALFEHFAFKPGHRVHIDNVLARTTPPAPPTIFPVNMFLR